MHVVKPVSNNAAATVSQEPARASDKAAIMASFFAWEAAYVMKFPILSSDANTYIFILPIH